MNILLVEDSVMCAKYFIAQAKQILNGHTIDLVRNIKDARDRILGIDLIVLDLDLPDSRIEETISQIKQWKGLFPIVIYSGNATPETINKCLEAGANVFIAKQGVTSEQIQIALQSAIKLSDIVILKDKIKKLNA